MNYNEIYKYEQYKRCSRVKNENSRGEQVGMEKRTPDGLPRIHAFMARL